MVVMALGRMQITSSSAWNPPNPPESLRAADMLNYPEASGKLGRIGDGEVSSIVLLDPVNIIFDIR